MCVTEYVNKSYKMPVKIFRMLRRRNFTLKTLAIISWTVIAFSQLKDIFNYSDNSLDIKTCVFNYNCTHQIPFLHFVYPMFTNMSKLLNEYKNKPNFNITPIFKYPYVPLVFPEKKCSFQINVFKEKSILLFLIKSDPSNFERREAIRLMWGNENLAETKHMSIQVKTVFLLAVEKNDSISSKVKEEISLKNDIVQLSFIDNYYNNTLKTIGGLTWATEYCSQAKFLMFVDDDFYVNPVLVIEHLEALEEKQTKSLFLGKLWKDIPQRGKHEKWYMPVSVYPFDEYPPFLSAGCMILSMDFAKDLRIAAMYTRKFKFDDVFLAIVAYKLKVKPQHNDFIRISEGYNYTVADFHKVLAAHRYGNFKELKNAWNIFQNNSKKIKFSSSNLF